MKRIKKKLKKLVNVVTASAFITCMQMSTVMAATDTNSVTKPLDNLKTLLLAVIGAVGVIILAKNVRNLHRHISIMIRQQ